MYKGTNLSIDGNDGQGKKEVYLIFYATIVQFAIGKFPGMYRIDLLDIPR